MNELMVIKVKDCVGCGFCCTKAVCAAGIRVHGPVTSCPSLIWDEEKHRHLCKLATLPGDLGFRYREELYIGAGCCCGLFNDWRNNIQDRTLKPKNKIIEIDRHFKLFLYNLGKQWISKDVLSLTLMGFIRDLRSWILKKKESGRWLKK